MNEQAEVVGDPGVDLLVDAQQKLGGNPDIAPYVQGPVRPPDANEAGWKDTVTMFPGQVTRIAVRYAPTDKPIGDASLVYPFDPDAKAVPGDAVGHGYVWHCHIVDHEDNEMMRPYRTTPDAAATRSFEQGTRLLAQAAPATCPVGQVIGDSLDVTSRLGEASDLVTSLGIVPVLELCPLVAQACVGALEKRVVDAHAVETRAGVNVEIGGLHDLFHERSDAGEAQAFG
jgi:hypothetical protein